MEAIELLHVEYWKPFSYLGLNHPFFALNKYTIINTWVVLGIILFFTIFARYFLKKSDNLISYLIISTLDSFVQFLTQTIGFFSASHFYFIVSLFIFITLCNTLSIIPWLEEPTQDLNTTLILGIISFLYIQIQTMKKHGILTYLKEYFQPFFIMFPLHVVGKLATIISISFRLYGNIFGGATISHLYFGFARSSILYEIIGIVIGGHLLITIFFGIFEGLLQAFVFSMLTLTYLSISLHGD